MNQLKIIIGIALMLAATACATPSTSATSATPAMASSTNVPAASTPTPPNPSATPIARTASASSTAIAPANISPLQTLMQAFQNWSAVKSFRAQAKIQSASNATPNVTLTTNLEAVLPDRFHITSPLLEAITIGQTVYLKTGNQWQKATLPPGFDMSFANITKYQADLGMSNDIKYLGTENLDGAPMQVYQYSATLQTPTPTSFTSKIWLAVSDHLPRRAEILDKNGTTTLVTFSDYNANIVIDAPIK